MGQKSTREKSPQKPEQKDIIFIYDLKSTVKHFLAGTSLVNDVDNVVRYDDYELVQHKRGVEIKSLTIYREDNKIVGYTIIYKDADKKELKLERIASKYAKSKNKRPYVLKLAYNEHLADIDIVYTFDCIKYIEIVTSKGQFLKAGVDIEDGYTSISKIDVNQKSYMPIVAFETTFTKEGLKEIFVYRSPVRFSKKRKRRALTVNEINSLKAAPNLESLKKAQRNLELIRNITKKSIMQLKILNQFKSLATKSESPGTNVNEPSLGLLEPASTKVIKEDQYMEDQEFGIDHEQEDEEQKFDAKSSPIRVISKKISSAPFNFINLFKRKESTHSSTNKDQGSRENSPDQTFISPARPKALNIFSLLRFNSLKKVIGVGSPHTGGSLSKNQSTPGESAANTPKKRRGNRSKSNLASPGLREPPLRKKATIEEALGNLDSDEDDDKVDETPKIAPPLVRQNTRRHTVQSPSSKVNDIEDILSDTKPIKKAEPPKKTPSPRQSQKIQRTSILARSGRPSIQSKDLQRNTSSSDSSSDSDSDSQGEPNVKTFTDAIERYEIASKMSSLLNLQNAIPKPKANSGAIGLTEKRAVGLKRYSAAEFIKPNLGLEFNAAGITRSKAKAASRLELGQAEVEARENKKRVESRKDLDSAMKKILSNVADKKYEQQPEVESAKLPIRRSAAKESKTTIMKSPIKSVTGKKNTFFGDSNY